jgi:N-acetylglucosamine-6-phosphate deacetylase
MGHTSANAKQANAAIKNGAKHFTHLFNSMPKFEHRNPTIINEAFNNKNTYCELICDLIHIEPLVIKNIYQSIGCDRIILITDTLSCKGLKNGRYALGSMPINKHNHIATLLDNKSIAGSIQLYIQQLRNFYKTTKCSLNDLVKVSSYNAAKSLNLLNNFGQIKVGCKANFVIVDNNINLKSTYVNGEKLN